MSFRLRKLRGMSPREILFRLRHRAAIATERKRFFSGAFAWSDSQWAKKLCASEPSPPCGADLAHWWEMHMRDRDEGSMLLAPASVSASCDLFRDLFPGQVEKIEASAEAICQGHFSLLGVDVVLEDPIDWHRDPKSGHAWDPAFHADVDFAFCREEGGDVKYVWELSRQDYLIDCAIAFRLTGKKVFADRVNQLVQGWIAKNPFLSGIHWSSALEVAVRALNWIWSYQFCRHDKFLSPAEHLTWIKAFYQHGFYLHRHLSYYFSPNNHLIAEATGLFILGCFFPEFDESAAWRSHGWKVIEEYSQRQYYEDGGTTEQATFYHNYCLGFLLLALLVRQARGEPIPGKLHACIERALDFTLWMTRSDGTVPRIGDVDNARSFQFGDEPLWDFRNLLSIGAALYERPDMKYVAGKFYEDALWLLGPEGFHKFQELTAKPANETVREFPTSGYYVARSGWGEAENHLTFDCGPLAAGLHTSTIPSSAHGHSDLLSATLSVAGKPLLVDGGFYTYDEDPLWHRYFREASAHNTILVDGASHANYHPSNAWSSVAVPGPMISHSSDLFDYVESFHAGFFGVSPPVCHRRSIFHDRDRTWLILDRLEGEGTHQIETFFHLAPSEVAPWNGRDALQIKTDQGLEVEFEVHDWPKCQIEIIAGGEGPDGGWIGTGYGYRQRAPVIRIWGSRCLPAAFCFSIRRVKKVDVQ